MAHVRIWKFRPPKDREDEFAYAYAGNGAWAEVFRGGEGYLGTELLRPIDAGGWWVTIDRWRSLDDFAAFEAAHGEAYRALDAELEGVAGEEEFIGAFEEDD